MLCPAVLRISARMMNVPEHPTTLPRVLHACYETRSPDLDRTTAICTANNPYHHNQETLQYRMKNMTSYRTSSQFLDTPCQRGGCMPSIYTDLAEESQQEHAALFNTIITSSAATCAAEKTKYFRVNSWYQYVEHLFLRSSSP